MIPTEKLGAACFLENKRLFSNHETQAEKYNLYTGLAAMAETVEALLQNVHTLEARLNSIAQKIDVLSYENS